MLKKFILLAMLVMTAFVFSGFSEAATPKWVLIQDVHHVQEGETLDGITRVYIKKNTYGTREFQEFREGIIELNNLHEKNINPGQELRINYWVIPEEILNR